MLEVRSIKAVSECVSFDPLACILAPLSFNPGNLCFDSKVHLKPFMVILFLRNPGSVTATLWVEM